MKNMFLFIVLMISFNLRSQESGDVSLHLSASYPLYHQDKAIQNFQQGYSEIWNSEIQKDFHNSGIPFSYQLGLTWWMNSFMGFCLDHEYLTYSKEINFNSDERRLFRYKVRTPFEGGLTFGNPARWAMNLKFGFATSTFISSYYYKNGERDMNYNSPLNGVYSANGFSYEAELQVRLSKRIAITGSFGGISGSEYTDKSFLKGIDVHGINETVYFPEDYPLYYSLTSAGTSYDFPLDKIAKLRHMNASVGLQYDIKLFNKEL